MSRDLLAEAVLALCARDEDRASLSNDIGYNGSDSKFGHRLRDIGPTAWTPAQRREAWDMLRKYSKQLATVGIAYDDIEEPPVAAGDARRDAYFMARRKTEAKAAAAAPKTLDWNGKEFILSFAYDDRLVSAARNISGRRYNGVDKTNRYPKFAARALAEFCAAEGFTVSVAAQAVLDEAASIPEPAAIEQKDTHFELRWPKGDPQFRDKLEAIRGISGATWDRDGEFWNVPTTSGHELAGFIERFSIECPAELMAELRGAKDKADALYAASLAADAEVEVEVEGLGGTLRPFQRGTIAYVRQLPQPRTFLADDMGLGKTIQALAVIEDQNAYPAVAIVPAGVRTQWRRMVQQWLPHRSVEIMYEDSDQLPSSDIVIVGYNTLGEPVIEKRRSGNRMVDKVVDVVGLAKLLVQINPDAVVVDEGHYVKEPKSKRTRCVSWIMEQAQPRVRLDATGTPVKNRHRELLEQLKLLGMIDAFGGEYRYLKRYCDGGKQNGYQDWSASINGDELFDKLRSIGFIRRTEDEVKGELPDKPEPMPLMLDSDPRVLKQYRKADADVVAFIREQVAQAMADADEEADAEAIEEAAIRASRAQQLVRLNKLRKLAGQAKTKAAIEWIRNFLNSTTNNGDSAKLLVFAWHEEVIDEIAKAFDALVIRGGMNDAQKDAAKEAFISDPTARVLVGNIQSAGTGLDGLQYAAHDGLVLEYPWTPGEINQAIGRLRRMGQAHRLRIWWAMADGCEIDEDMVELIGAKQAVLDKMDPNSPKAKKVADESVVAGVVRKRLERQRAAMVKEGAAA